MHKQYLCLGIRSLFPSCEEFIIASDKPTATLWKSITATATASRYQQNLLGDQVSSPTPTVSSSLVHGVPAKLDNWAGHLDYGVEFSNAKDKGELIKSLSILILAHYIFSVLFATIFIH